MKHYTPIKPTSVKTNPQNIETVLANTDIPIENHKNILLFVSWWVPFWQVLFPIIFFGIWWIACYVISTAMPKANGKQFEEIGLLLGLPLAAISTVLIKIFIYDIITEKMLDKLSAAKNNSFKKRNPA